MTLGLWSFLYLPPPTLLLVDYLYYLLMLHPLGWGVGEGCNLFGFCPCPISLLVSSVHPALQMRPQPLGGQLVGNDTLPWVLPTPTLALTLLFPLALPTWVSKLAMATMLSFPLLFPTGRMKYRVSLEDVDKHE